MWVSNKYQMQWWLPPRTASRMTSNLLKRLGFRQEWGHHTVFGESRHDVYLNIRNPYTICISWYIFTYQQHGLPFEDYVRFGKGDYTSAQNNTFHTHLLDYIEALKERNLTVKKIIRYENLVEDLLSVPIIGENQFFLQEELEELYQGTGFWRNENQKKFYDKPYSEYYTQELADIVYENRKKYFDFGNYEKDSWKNL